jgi:hypothetical protein
MAFLAWSGAVFAALRLLGMGCLGPGRSHHQAGEAKQDEPENGKGFHNHYSLI